MLTWNSLESTKDRGGCKVDDDDDDDDDDVYFAVVIIYLSARR